MHTLQLPSLDKTIEIDEACINEFRNNGHTITKNVLASEEVQAYRDVINYAHRKADRQRWLGGLPPGSIIASNLKSIALLS
jgi:hypothetical protein